MYKELLAGIIICLISFFVLKKLQKKNGQLLSVIIFSTLIISIIANCCFNLVNVFPSFYLHTAMTNKGDYEWHKFGDIEKNLFSYSEEHIFPDQIIFQVLKNRDIYLDNSKNEFYDKFLNIYADSVKKQNLAPSEFEENTKSENYSFSCRFKIPKFMDYAMDADWKVLETFQNNPPTLYIKLENLKNADSLTALVDKNNNLYIY